jgi:hypothetical protein
MWPDFISDNWDSYYLYSEFPSNIQGVKYIPFFKECVTKKKDDQLIDSQKFISIKRTHGNKEIESIVYSVGSEGRQRFCWIRDYKFNYLPSRTSFSRVA